jgi:sec-independent protein translocase protein TatB
MFGVGWTEILVILVVALLVLGPNKLPEIAKGLGKGIRDFRKAMNSLEEDDDHPRPAAWSQPVNPPAPPPVLPPAAPVDAAPTPPALVAPAVAAAPANPAASAVPAAPPADAPEPPLERTDSRNGPA